MAMFEAKYESILRGKQQNPSENFEDMISSHAATPQVATPQSEQGSRPSQDPPAINQKCQLLHWYNYEYEEVVAEGHIASVDPNTKVHHMPLGRDCWKVWVDIVLNEDVQLYRITDELNKLGQALGSTVGWPKSSIKMINEELEYLHCDNGN